MPVCDCGTIYAVSDDPGVCPNCAIGMDEDLDLAEDSLLGEAFADDEDDA